MNGCRILREYVGRTFRATVSAYGVTTFLPDGSHVVGVPLGNISYQHAAFGLGYGTDTFWHAVEHDIAHNLIADFVGAPYSGALWDQAHDAGAHLREPTPERDREERHVTALQSALNGQPWGRQQLRELMSITNMHRLFWGSLELLRPGGRAMSSGWAGRA